jgi:hypothetical protein
VRAMLVHARLFAAVAVGVVLGCGAPTSDTPPREVGPSATAAPATPPTPVVPAPEGLPDAEELLNASVVALGGAEKIEAITSYYSESEMNASKLGLFGTAKTWWRAGDFYTETSMPGVGLMRLGGLSGEVWGEDPINGLRALSGVEAEQARWSASLCLAHDWRRYFARAETKAVVERDGRRVAEIELTSRGGDLVTLRIDLESKAPVSQTFKQANPLGDMPVTVSFGELREVAGVKISFEQQVDAALTQLSTRITKIEANVDVNPEIFAMPRAGERLHLPLSDEPPAVAPVPSDRP